MSYIAELRAHYAAVDARLGVPPKPPKEMSWEERNHAVITESSWPFVPTTSTKIEARKEKLLVTAVRNAQIARRRAALARKFAAPPANAIDGFWNDPKQLAKRIVAEESALADVSVKDIMGRSQLGYIVAVRKRCMSRIYYEIPGMKCFSSIGRFFGKDHTTVMNALGLKKRYSNARRRAVG